MDDIVQQFISGVILAGRINFIPVQVYFLIINAKKRLIDSILFLAQCVDFLYIITRKDPGRQTVFKQIARRLRYTMICSDEKQISIFTIQAVQMAEEFFKLFVQP